MAEWFSYEWHGPGGLVADVCASDAHTILPGRPPPPHMPQRIAWAVTDPEAQGTCGRTRLRIYESYEEAVRDGVPIEGG